MYPFKPLTKLGHHLVDGLLIDALLLRTAPFESGHITGHSTPLHAPSASVQQHIETFATMLKSTSLSFVESVETIKPITTSLPGFMSLPGSFPFSCIRFPA